MPKTVEQKKRESVRPGFCDLLPVRAFLDDVMVRDNGAFVAGFQLSGAHTYFADDEGRNDTKHMIESLVLTIPEESIRVQFRYEVVENTYGLLDRYENLRTATDPRVVEMDRERVATWSAQDARGEYLTRLAGAYFIWDPVKHDKVMAAAGGAIKKEEPKKPAKPKRERRPGFFGAILDTISDMIEAVTEMFNPVSISKNVEREEKKHNELLRRFEAIMQGVQESLKRAELGPVRMSHEELFLEIKRSLLPTDPDALPLKDYYGEGVNVEDVLQGKLPLLSLSERYISAREQLASVSILGQSETALNIDGILWSAVTLKLPPDTTMPGVLRELLTLGFPLVINTHFVVPDQTKVLAKYKARYKKFSAALNDGKGGQRADVTAAVAAREVLAIQEKIIASSVKTVRLNLTVLIRTSHRAYTEQEHERALQQIAERTQKVLHVIGRMNGARGFHENLALRDILIDSLPGMCGEQLRDLDLLSEHAADLIAVELPFQGTTDDPAMLFRTPYRQLLPYSHFSPTIENANMILAATSGTGKGMLVGKMLLTYARLNAKVSILERGDSYASAIEYIGGQMLTMSLDSPYTINPFDLEPGETEPSNDHLTFLRNLIRYMVGTSGNSDTDLLDSAITQCIKDAYDLASMRPIKIPTLSDVRDGLGMFLDKNQNAKAREEALTAASKLQPWVEDGPYATLFDRPTSIDMTAPWLYFNVEKLKDDPKLEVAMSLLIAYATTKRAIGTGRQKSITVLDECWSLLESESLGPVVVQLFRTARKRNACVWGISQAVADFTGTAAKPNKYGEAILTTTATKMIGRQKGNTEVLKDFVHLNPTTINYIKNLPMTEKGKFSEFVGIIGEKAETTFPFLVIPTPTEYWVMTTYPREKDYRKWWLHKHDHLPLEQAYALLAKKYPHGISMLDKLPEEVSGAVWDDLLPPTGLLVSNPIDTTDFEVVTT